MSSCLMLKLTLEPVESPWVSILISKETEKHPPWQYLNCQELHTLKNLWVIKIVNHTEVAEAL